MKSLKPLMAGLSTPRRTLAAGAGAGLVGTFVFLKLSDEILDHQFVALDRAGLQAARQIQSRPGERVVRLIAYAGNPLVLAVLGSAAGLGFVATGPQSDGVTLAAAGLGAGLFPPILKRIFHRPRPPVPLRHAPAKGYSFPSGHAFTSLTTYGGMTYLAVRRGRQAGHPEARWLWLPGLLWAGLVGASRVYLEVHYPTDVLASWAAGTIWLAACIVARNVMPPEQR